MAVAPFRPARPVLNKGGCNIPLGVSLAAALLLGGKASDASAASLGGVATSFGWLAALCAILLMRAWQAHILVGSLSTLGLMMAFSAAVALLWRCRRPVFSAYSRARRAPASPRRAAPRSPRSTSEILLPAGVDRQNLIGELRRHFLELQAAWDVGAPDSLRCLTTPDMLAELCAARAAGFEAPHRSDVVTLDVNLVAFEERGATQLACVEFSGWIRESPASTPTLFRELWMLSRTQSGPTGWRLARHQALL